MKRLIASTATVLLSACSSGSNAPLSFSVSTKAATSSSHALVVAGNVDIQRVRLNVGRLKLEGAGSALDAGQESGSGEDGDDVDGGDDRNGGDIEQGEVEVKQGPFLVDLDATALNGVVTKVFDASVPPG